MADFVCITGAEGATLVVTYKGAHAARPADEVDVDSFVGVKSHRAKGKRITTYDVASLSFIEPELPEQPDMEEIEEMDDAAIEVDLERVGEVVIPADSAEQTMPSQEVEPVQEHILTIDPEQLNLF
jgi:topoisomerase-4 subunit A